MASHTRNSRTPKPDGRNRTVAKVGGREDFRVFRFPNSVSPKEIEARLSRLKDIYAVCGGWNDLSNFLAPHIHKGVVLVPLPPKELSSILGVKFDGWVHWRTVLVSQLPSIRWEACRPIRAEGRVWPVLGGGFQTAVAGLRPGGHVWLVLGLGPRHVLAHRFPVDAQETGNFAVGVFGCYGYSIDSTDPKM